MGIWAGSEDPVPADAVENACNHTPKHNSKHEKGDLGIGLMRVVEDSAIAHADELKGIARCILRI